jgi:hypothetical protein
MPQPALDLITRRYEAPSFQSPSVEWKTGSTTAPRTSLWKTPSPPMPGLIPALHWILKPQSRNQPGLTLRQNRRFNSPPLVPASVFVAMNERRSGCRRRLVAHTRVHEQETFEEFGKTSGSAIADLPSRPRAAAQWHS